MIIDKILMPTDFSRCAGAALGPALSFARRFQAELHLLHVIELHGDSPMDPLRHFPDAGEIYERLEEIAGAELRQLYEPRQVEGLRLREHQRRAISAAQEIVDFVARERIGLVVMGTHGRRGLRRLLLGSVAEEVVRRSPSAVLTVPAGEEAPRLETIASIVAPVDFSDGSRAALGTAAELATVFASRLWVLHVLEQPLYPPSYGPLSFPAPVQNTPQMIASIEKGLEEMVADTVSSSVDCGVRVIQGRSTTAIADYAASEGADLVVMATKGLTGIEHLLVGSVAENTVRSCRCPVLTLKPQAGAQSSR